MQDRLSVVLFLLYFIGFCVAPPIVLAIVRFAGSYRRKSVAPPPAPSLASGGVLVLRPDNGLAAFELTLVGALMLIGVILLVYYVVNNEAYERGLGLFYSIVIIFAGFKVLVPLKYKIVLERDAIALVKIFRTKRLRREDIKGKRYVRTRFSLGSYILYPKQNYLEKIWIHNWYENDELKKWLNDIPWIGKPPRGFRNSGDAAPKAPPTHERGIAT